MDRAEAEQIRERACRSKRRFNRANADEIARTQPQPCHGYRCPFCGFFHVGKVPSVERVQALADAVRYFATGFTREET